MGPMEIGILYMLFYFSVFVFILSLLWRIMKAVERIANALERRTMV